jgi:hypothetical protein
VSDEIEPGLPEARETAPVETLHIEDRVQHKSFVCQHMPFRVAARLSVYEAAEGLDLGFE